MYRNDVCICISHLPIFACIIYVYHGKKGKKRTIHIFREIYMYIYKLLFFWLYLFARYLLVHNTVYIIKEKRRTRGLLLAFNVHSFSFLLIIIITTQLFFFFLFHFFFLRLYHQEQAELSLDNCFFFVDCLYSVE